MPFCADVCVESLRVLEAFVDWAGAALRRRTVERCDCLSTGEGVLERKAKVISRRLVDLLTGRAPCLVC